MYFEINVSINGKHLFATHKRSLQNFPEAQLLFNLFMEKFPQSEGYNITITQYTEIGKILDIK